MEHVYQVMHLKKRWLFPVKFHRWGKTAEFVQGSVGWSSVVKLAHEKATFHHQSSKKTSKTASNTHTHTHMWVCLFQVVSALTLVSHVQNINNKSTCSRNICTYCQNHESLFLVSILHAVMTCSSRQVNRYGIPWIHNEWYNIPMGKEIFTTTVFYC